MSKVKVKPPKETKAELMEQVWSACMRKWPHQPDKAIDYLLNYFTSADLVGIREDLKK